MASELDHIAVANASIAKGIAFYRDLIGLEYLETEEVAEQKVKAAILQAGGIRIEILEPLSEDSPVARFIARRGEGLHHIAFRVDDIEAVLERFKAAGARLIDEAPRRGVGGTRIAFVHPAASNGVLIELVEQPK
ncbi:MAG: methylmalonyl-CoA epimerase [Planctomycetota bacterium]|jgi:methylmalonyl-CoA/ethylmalonyl-CoA epimerase